MSAAAQASRPRPGGGFNAGMGQFGEHMDEAAMQQALAQKAMSQQSGSTATVPTPKPASPQTNVPPKADSFREVGSLKDELVVRPLQDLWHGFKSIFDLRAALGLNEKTSEQQQELARQEMILKRYNQLTEEQQAIAQKNYQERLAKQQQEEQEKQQKAEAEQRQHQTIQAPSKAASGPVGPGMSGKQKAKAQLDFDRQRMSGPSSAN